MKLQHFSVSEREDGMEVSIVALLPLSDGFITPMDLGKALAKLSNVASRDPAPVPDPAEDVGGGNAVDALPAAEEPRRRRRHQNPLEPQEAAAAGAESPTDQGQPTETEVSPRRRRRASADSDRSNSAASTAGESATATEGSSDANPPRRRRRSASESEPTATETVTSSNTAEASGDAPTRRRRASAEGEQPKPAPIAASTPTAEDKISDADLSKAASDAARVLTPKVVTAYLAEFGVDHTGKLKGGDRRKFFDGLRAKKEAA